MAKNTLKYIGLIAAASYAFYWLKKKADAGKNLSYVPVSIQINKAKTKLSGYQQVFYTLALKLVNNEPAGINVKGVNLAISVDGKSLGTIINNTGFIVPANSEKLVKFENSINTLEAINVAKDIILDGMKSATVSGVINTDLGLIKTQFTIAPNGTISGPVKASKYKVGEKVYSYQNPYNPAEVSFIKFPESGYGAIKYKLAIYTPEGYSYSSNWIDEGSLSKKPVKANYSKIEARNYGRSWYITTSLELNGPGIKLAGSKEDHARGLYTYNVTNAAMKKLKTLFNVVQNTTSF